jgi:hypothetical protein
MPSRQPHFLYDDDEEIALFEMASWDLPGLTRKQAMDRRQPCKTHPRTR